MSVHRLLPYRIVIFVVVIIVLATSLVASASIEKVPPGSEVPSLEPVLIIVHGDHALKAIVEIGVTFSVSCSESVQLPPLPAVAPITILSPFTPLPLNGSMAYVAVIPGLPAFTVNFTVVEPGLPPKTVECTLSAAYTVNAKIYDVNAALIGEVSYRVVPIRPSTTPPPIVLIGVNGTGWLGASPQGFAVASGRTLCIHILAVAYNSSPQPYLEVIVNDKMRKRIQPVEDEEFAQMVANLQSWINSVENAVKNWVLGVAGRTPALPVFKPGVYIGYVDLGGEVGTFIEYHAVLEISGRAYSSQYGGVVFYNANSRLETLIIDTRLPVYLAYRSANATLENVENIMESWRMPVRALEEAESNATEIAKFLGAGVERPHWEYVALYSRVYIAQPGRELCSLLSKLKPNVIILGFAPLGVKTGNALLDSLLAGDLSKISCGDETLLEKLLRYVQERHAGLIVTMGALNGYELAECDPDTGEVKWYEYGLVGHIGTNLGVIDPSEPRALAPALGLYAVTLAEVVKRKLAEALCEAAHAASGKGRVILAELSSLIGSVPVLAYVPFNGTLNVTWEPLAKYMHKIIFKRSMPRIAEEYGLSGYTIVGWELQKPYLVFNAAWKIIRKTVESVKGLFVNLTCQMRNITRIVANLTGVHLNGTLAARAYNYSLEEMLGSLHSALAYMNISRGVANIPVNITAAKRIALSIAMNITELITKLLKSLPPRIAALSQDYLGGILLYDPAWLKNGYRAALVTFEAELLQGDEASKFWRVLLNWASSWRYSPENYTMIDGLVVNKTIAEFFEKLVEKVTKNARRVEAEALLLPEEGYVELNLTLQPGERVVLAVLHPDSRRVNVTVLSGNAAIRIIAEANYTTIVSVTGNGTVTIGIRADPDSVLTRAYVEVYMEAAGATTTTTTSTTTSTSTSTTTTATVTQTVTTTVTETVTKTITVTQPVISTTTVTVTVEKPMTKTVTSTVTSTTTATTTVTTTTTRVYTVVRLHNATVTITYTKQIVKTVTSTKTLEKTVTSTTATTVTKTIVKTRGVTQAGAYIVAALIAGLAVGFLIGKKG